MSYAYRSAYQHIIGTRLAEMKLAKERVEPLLPRLYSVYSARIARALAGGVGIAAAVAMSASALFDDGREPAVALVGGTAAAVGTYIVARTLLNVGRRFSRAPGWTEPALTGQLDTDLTRIEESNPLSALTAQLERLEVYSTALPLAAISLLAPLVLHFLVLTVFGTTSMDDFARWIRISLVIVGHAHLALMGVSISFARRMKGLDSEAIAALPITREWARALGIAVAVAAMPGVILLAVPPLLAAITGIAFIPFMFVLMRRRLSNERAVVELAEQESHVRITADPMTASAALDEAIWADSAVPEAALSARI